MNYASECRAKTLILQRETVGGGRVGGEKVFFRNQEMLRGTRAMRLELTMTDGYVGIIK